MFDVRCSMFDVRCSKFKVQGSRLQRSMFDVRCSMFDVRCSLFVVRCSQFNAPRPASDAQPHCRNNATATRALRVSKTPNSKLLCAQRQATKRVLLRSWNANCVWDEAGNNPMSSHAQMNQDRSVANYRRAPQTLDVRCSMFDVQCSRFPVELLPQKNAKQAKDAA